MAQVEIFPVVAGRLTEKLACEQRAKPSRNRVPTVSKARRLKNSKIELSSEKAGTSARVQEV